MHSYCRAKREMFVADPLKGAKLFELWQSKTGLHWRELEPATKFDKYECQVTEVVEDISSRKPKILTPEYDRVLIEVARNPPRMKVSHIDKKGRVADRNKQYQNGSYVLLSTDSTDTTDEMASPVFTLYGSRTVGSTIYRIVGKMTLDGEGPLYYGYYEEIHKDGYLDATIRAGNCSEKKAAAFSLHDGTAAVHFPAAIPGPTEPPQPFDLVHIAASFKELGSIYGGKTLAQAAAMLTTENKTAGARLIAAGKKLGLSPDTKLTDQTPNLRFRMGTGTDNRDS